MHLLSGKKILITGVASTKSIAWGIASAMHEAGAELAFTYQNERLKERVVGLAESLGSTIVMPCDVTSDDEIKEVAERLDQNWGSLDGCVHAMAYAPRDHLEGDYLTNLTREGFAQAHDISSYSFAALAQALRPLMANRAAAMLTLSYLGAVRALPNYNVMGVAKASLEANVRYMAYAMGSENIRVNAISAGPIRTLAASGIGNFKKLLDQAAHMSPLKRTVTIKDVGRAAAFLCSDWANGITGEITYVDAGFSTVGSPPIE